MTMTTVQSDNAIPVSESKLLAGKVAFITGGSRGIGKALCTIFAREGAHVAFNYNNNDTEAASTVAQIEAHGAEGQAFKVSVTDKAGIKSMVDQILDRWGHIDILVNNAAINKADSFVTTTEKSWLDVINININGLYYTTKPILKVMMKQRAGHILNITSIGAIRALPTSVHYATSKAAVVGFTKCLSKEAAAFGVSVNAIAAGVFDTALGHALPEKFTDIYQEWCSKKRFGNPEELAELAAFLVSSRNTYMAGEVITLDGGAIV
ncbi:MAG: SDR family oxidoreductase [Cyanobacteria bacterium P01_H01_bin.74]